MNEQAGLVPWGLDDYNQIFWFLEMWKVFFLKNLFLLFVHLVHISLSLIIFSFAYNHFSISWELPFLIYYTLCCWSSFLLNFKCFLQIKNVLLCVACIIKYLSLVSGFASFLKNFHFFNYVFAM